YLQLIQEHLAPLEPLAAGLRALPRATTAFAATQAAWRFYRNNRVGLSQLIQPLQQRACAAVTETCADYVLVTHDWSFLHYRHHRRKGARSPLSNPQDLGYDLLASLALSDGDGAPLPPVCQQPRAQAGVYSTRSRRRLASRSQLDELTPVLGHVQGLKLGKPV